MSYCRFSSDSFRSDVYVYESENGIQIHIAGNRLVLPDDTRMPSIADPDFGEKHKVWQEIVDNAPRVDIGLPLDGESFSFRRTVDVLEKLKEIKELGYRVPDYCIESLEDELKKESYQITQHILEKREEV